MSNFTFTNVDYQALEARAIAEHLAAVIAVQGFLYMLHGARVSWFFDEMLIEFPTEN